MRKMQPLTKGEISERESKPVDEINHSSSFSLSSKGRIHYAIQEREQRRNGGLSAAMGD